ncbi:hypothetical protein Q31b_32870 [Novipirellula aureliae]|uniref:Uncharacterized protein n=1 Tax=Novipirellula aureliae TaxID=2527966 RepID=A0A5C6DX60_9BACT|nr:hypothetical protein [Novipirellula aureliae]TWU39971.1 hypothetical protein Q31b_32870 [Novipirellula aureliae]
MMQNNVSPPTKTDDGDPLAQKVAKSLRRYGYIHIAVTHVGDRIILLSGLPETANDRALAVEHH